MFPPLKHGTYDPSFRPQGSALVGDEILWSTRDLDQKFAWQVLKSRCLGKFEKKMIHFLGNVGKIWEDILR